MELSAVEGVMQCRNAKPPINHDIKHAQEAEIKRLTVDYLNKGGEIEELPSFDCNPKHLTFK